jgi:hypothetical protein
MNVLSPSSGLKSKPIKKPAGSKQTFASGFLLDVPFNLEDGGDMFLQNVC